MNIQNEPMFDIASNFSAVLLQVAPELKHALVGWPDRKWIQVENQLPAVFFVDVSETGRHYISQTAVSNTVDKGDGTGYLVREKMRLRTMIQVSLFTNTKSDRDRIGWLIKQHLITNYRIPIIDYAAATPAPTGEHLLVFFRNDRKDIEGEANFWRRDLTFEIQSRVLDAEAAFKVTTADVEVTSEHKTITS